MPAFRHNLKVHFHRKALSGESKPLDQLLDIELMLKVLRFAIQIQFHGYSLAPAMAIGNRCMKIALLSRDSGLYANRRLREAALLRGAELAVIDPLAQIEEADLKTFDAVMPRFGPIWQKQGGVLLARLQSAGAVCLNTPEAVALARDKPAAMQAFMRLQLPMPSSVTATTVLDAYALERLPFAFPMLIKDDASAGGWGIHRVDDAAAAIAVMTRLHEEGARYTLQAFIAEAAGRDIRAFVCGGRVIAAMQRTAAPGEFRANIRLGARADAIMLPESEAALALAAAAALGLDVAGVDLLRCAAGPLLLEVNAAPGFEALEAATGCDIAGQMLDLLISRTNRQKTGL